MAITQDFMFETDDLNDFLKVAKSIIPVLFSAGSNENPQYHNMYYDVTEKPRYWTLMDDSDGVNPERKCVICLSHHLSKPHSVNEIEVPMEFKKDENSTTRWNLLKWKKKSYKKITELIKESIDVDQKEFSKSFPVNGWIAEESMMDGSHGFNYKMEWRESSPGALYISLGASFSKSLHTIQNKNMLTENKLSCAINDSDSDIVFLQSLDGKLIVMVGYHFNSNYSQFTGHVVQSKSHEEGKVYAKNVSHMWKKRIQVGHVYDFNYEDFEIINAEIEFKRFGQPFKIKNKTVAEIREEKLNKLLE